jgi:uncharacterized membrane protein
MHALLKYSLDVKDREVSMVLQVWYFITLVLTALLMGTTFDHALEMPAKMNMPGSLWMTLQQTLYPAFASIGGAIEMGAIIRALVLAVLVRQHKSAFYLALTGTVMLVVAFFVVWVMFTRPVNTETATWTVASLPADWTQWRRRWEYSHATRFALQLIGFGALVFSLLVEASIWPKQS